jgi:signal recognition particle GTPase
MSTCPHQHEQAHARHRDKQLSLPVLAKLDGTAKGGVVVAIRKTVGLPVKYVGVGEKAEDLVLFDPGQGRRRTLRRYC